MTAITKTYYSNLLTNKIDNLSKSLIWHLSLPIDNRDLILEKVLFNKIQTLSSKLIMVSDFDDPDTVYELSDEELYNLH